MVEGYFTLGDPPWERNNKIRLTRKRPLINLGPEFYCLSFIISQLNPSRVYFSLSSHKHSCFSNCVILFRFNRKKMSLQQRKARVAQKKAYFLKQQGEGDDDDDDDGSDDE